MGGIDDITALLEKVERIDVGLKDGTMMRDAVAVWEGRMIEANQKQMYSGLDSNDEEIWPEYSPQTVRNKMAEGQPYDRVTLKDTGRFYDEMGIIYGDDSFEITSRDWKTEKLKEKYGQAILGLNDKSMDDFSFVVSYALLEDFEMILFGEQ